MVHQSLDIVDPILDPMVILQIILCMDHTDHVCILECILMDLEAQCHRQELWDLMVIP